MSSEPMNIDHTNCPSCRAPMKRVEFPRKIRGQVELDLCFSCQGIWFDEYESLQLAPEGVISLFKLLHQHRDDQRLPLGARLLCPRCAEPMVTSQDRVKSGVFNYLRCLQQHGRFITFGQFMIEKGFVRQLLGREIKELAAQIGTVRCTGCGAPVDIRHDSACTHCRAPIAILDPAAVEQALARYEQSALKAAAAPDPNLVAETLLYAERDRSRQQRASGNLLTTDIADLLAAGIETVWDKLRDRVGR
jgi:hypothetical protein